MEEAFLHFAWQQGHFDHSGLATSQGHSVEILRRGALNSNSGPDFGEAQIRIGGQVWSGNVEIHVLASDWNRHGHQTDPTYNNTILHVVYENDAEVLTQDHVKVPCIELKNRIPGSLYQNYRAFRANLDLVPCARNNPAKLLAQVLQMIHRAVVERLFLKARVFEKVLQSVNGDWQLAFYIFLARYLGFKINADAMETLARATPLQVLMRSRDSLQTTEALLFGQAGMLELKSGDPYYLDLQKEYRFLRHKHNLVAVNIAGWKFMRMRPINFPTIRISQLAALLTREPFLFSKIIESRGILEMRNILSADASAYWRNHYHFQKKTVLHSTSLGSVAQDGLLINVVAVVLFAYGNAQNSDEYKERALDILSELEPENNKITRYWEQLGFENSTAYHSQALLGLLDQYCNKRKCLECAIGQKILTAEPEPMRINSQ